MTQLQAIRWFANEAAAEKVIIARNHADWSIDIDNKIPRLIIPSDPMKVDDGDKLFRVDFIKRCPIGANFADITLSILHELGHHFNRQAWIDQDLDEYEAATGQAHFDLPCERVATDWAIKWLQTPSHQKIAKKFEKALDNLPKV